MEPRFYEKILDVLCEALITVDQTRKIVVWNNKAETIFGYTKEEIREKGLEAIIPPVYRERHREAYESFVRNIGTRSSYVSESKESEGLRKSGELFPIEITHSLLKITDQEFYITAVVRDITMARQYQLMRDRLEHITRHDLKNKLVIIGLSAKRMAKSLQPEVAESVSKYIDIVQDESKEVIALLDSTRDLIRLETGEYERRDEEVALADIVASKGKQMQPMAEAKDVDIVLHNHLKQPDLTISADRMGLERALENLIKNAIEAEEPRGKILLVLENDPKGIPILEICNKGKPVPEEIRATLFQPYVTHGKKGGTGLGLYSSKLMLEKIHGWQLSFRSGPEGTVFRITFG